MYMAAMGHQMQAWDLGCLPPKEIGRVRRPSRSTVYALAEHPSLVHATGMEAAVFKQLPNNVEHIMGAGAQGGQGVLQRSQRLAVSPMPLCIHQAIVSAKSSVLPILTAAASASAEISTTGDFGGRGCCSHTGHNACTWLCVRSCALSLGRRAGHEAEFQICR